MKRILLLLTAFCMATFNMNGKFSQKASTQHRYLLGLRVILLIVRPQMLLGKVHIVRLHHRGASGITNHLTTTGSYAMWVDGSSPYSLGVSITTDSIDVSSLTTPFY